MKSEIVRPLKRKKTQEQSDDGEVDLLSMLPDSIIVSILSQLTIAEAARTCVLSLRWRYLWTYYFGSLNFDASLVRNDRTSSLWMYKRDLFKRRVDQVLNSLQTQTVEALEICFDLGNDSHVDNWVQFAIQKKAKKLDLKMDHYAFNTIDNKHCDVPPSLLKLSSLPSLQVLRLSFVDVSGEDLECLLSSCPSLQTLSVDSPKRLVSLRVCSHSNIKELEIRLCNDLKTIIISAENLRSFSHFGYYVSINYEHIPNLKEVCFGGPGLDGMFTDFFHLTIYDHSSSLKVLKLNCCLKFKCELPDNMVLANLQHLELNYCLMQQNVYYLCISLMNRCPSVRSLTLKTITDLNRPLIFEPDHAYDCLEEVKLINFAGKNSEVRIMKYIIKNASNLKKILLGGTAHYSSSRMRRMLAPFTPPRVEFVIM